MVVFFVSCLGSNRKAFISYIRAVHLRGDKSVFDVEKLPLSEYATAIGLPVAPRVRFVEVRNLETSAPDRFNYIHILDFF